MAENATVDALLRLKQAIEPLFTGNVSVKTVWRALTTLVLEAEKVYDGVGRGEEKHAAVREIWKELDERYKLVDMIDAAIPAPWYIEPFDGKLIRLGIDVLISLIVTALNMTVWKR